MKRTAAVLLAVTACAAPTHHAPSAPPGEDAVATASPGVHCGYVRWAVKTGADPAAAQINLKPVAATITALRATKPPYPPPTSKYPPNYKRFPAEERTVTVTATLIAYNAQQDGDFHLVLADGQATTMIAEIPNPACVKSGPLLKGITKARRQFIARTHYNPPAPKPGQYSPPFVAANYTVTVTGVVFYDFVHGQHGVAPNGVELHPVLDITFH